MTMVTLRPGFRDVDATVKRWGRVRDATRGTHACDAGVPDTRSALGARQSHLPAIGV